MCPGRVALRQGVGTLRTYRSGFGLATTSVQSAYQFGGIADFLFLEPTAGREALTTDSMQLLQSIIVQIDDFASAHLAAREESDSSTPFMAWAARKKQYELCGNLRIRREPGEALVLSRVRQQSRARQFLYYGGADQSVIQAHASDENPLLVLARSNPRRQCEMEYLRRFCNAEEVSDTPRVLEVVTPSSWSLAESGLSFRVAAILSTDYFLEATIQFGRISHDLPVLVEKRPKPVVIWLNPAGATIRLLLDLYTREYRSFDSMTKDFVRNVIFPRISDLVPSSTRAGAEAFLKSIQRPREVFEYEASDLQSLSSIWSDYLEGKLTMQEAAQRSTRVVARSVQVIESSAAASIRDVVPDVIENERALQGEVDQAESRDVAAPPIERRELQTEAKLLTIDATEPALRGFRCFLSLSDRIREERGDFFLQPHRTSIVWGGQKALFVFEHHSGRFGLYYEIQTPDLLSHASGGGPYPTATIVTKNRIYVPVPVEIEASFLPQTGERKRLEVKCDILYTNASGD